LNFNQRAAFVFLPDNLEKAALASFLVFPPWDEQTTSFFMIFLLEK